MTNEAVCRTAPATPGLSINVVNNSRKEDTSVKKSKEAKEANKAALGLDS